MVSVGKMLFHIIWFAQKQIKTNSHFVLHVCILKTKVYAIKFVYSKEKPNMFQFFFWTCFFFVWEKKETKEKNNSFCLCSYAGHFTANEKKKKEFLS